MRISRDGQHGTSVIFHVEDGETVMPQGLETSGGERGGIEQLVRGLDIWLSRFTIDGGLGKLDAKQRHLGIAARVVRDGKDGNEVKFEQSDP